MSLTFIKKIEKELFNSIDSHKMITKIFLYKKVCFQRKVKA